MSTKKIKAGDTLTVGDLTDDYLGAVIEVEMSDEVTTRLRLGLVTPRGRSTDVGTQKKIWACDDYPVRTWLSSPVTVITPPPVVQPDEPTKLGQCIRIEGDDKLWGVVVDPGTAQPIKDWHGHWRSWDAALLDAGDRQIIVSDPPRWPDETPAAPERIEVGEWPDDDMHLREWEWHSVDHRFGDDHTALWDDQESQWECPICVYPWRGGLHKYAWTRGERVK